MAYRVNIILWVKSTDPCVHFRLIYPKASQPKQSITLAQLEQIEPTIQQAISRFGRHRIAVIIGTSTTGVDENLPVFKYAAEHEDWSGAEFNQQQQYFSAPADFIAHQYGLTNLIYGISTACTSGAKALISAARLLNANLCDAVICGGVDTLSLLTLVGFNSLSVLSAEQTNPFLPTDKVSILVKVPLYS